MGRCGLKLHELFDENNVFLQKKFNNKEEIITFLVENLYKLNKINDKETILRELLEREKVSSSGVNDNIAIPHLKTDLVENFIGAFCTLKKGIDFSSLDGKEVYIVFLLIAPKVKTNEYLTLLAKFSRIFKKETNRDIVRKFTGPDEFIDFLKTQEE